MYREMDISKIEHIGIAVRSIEAQLPYYEGVLGLKCYATEDVIDQGVRTAFFLVGSTKLELLEPLSDSSPIAKFLEKRGEGIHHLAFAVADVDTALSEVSSKGVQLIDKVSRGGAEGLSIGFLHPRSTGGVLTELCSPVVTGNGVNVNSL
jgi:methylmalonyl-CoA/ethylmalonyl-CoA epimerase